MYSAAGIILAGGYSKRMGQDKALLPCPNNQQISISFVEQLATLLLSACSEVILVTRDVNQATDYARYVSSLVHIVTDKTPDIGPLMGLYSGLCAMRSSHALVTAVDTPFLQSSVISFLLSEPLNEQLVIPIVNNLPQVLLAIYPDTILPAIEERLQAGRRDPRALLQVAKVQFIEEEQLRAVDPHLLSFVNINTPEELASSKTSFLP
ncbi:MAG TPA: molybdenum cofactor guanylyltransferase [Ktedonobacteraceae bacterium]|jgi:molybdopterin-guanine dinucleotide biosynthesis protein A